MEEYNEKFKSNEIFLKAMGKTKEDINKIYVRHQNLITTLPKILKITKVKMFFTGVKEAWKYKDEFVPKNIIKRELSEKEEKDYPELFL